MIAEPSPATWSDIALHLVHYETILREQPSLRDLVLSLAHRLLRYSARVPGPMPDAVAATFARIGISV